MAKINFGKYKGMEVREVKNVGYLKWIVDTYENKKDFNIADDIYKEAKEIVGTSDKKPSQSSSGGGRDVVLNNLKSELKVTQESKESCTEASDITFFDGMIEALKIAISIVENA